MAPSVVSLKGRRRDADARSVSRVRSLGPWLVPATLAAALSAHAASRGDEALNDLPYFVGATARLGLDTYADPSLQVGPLWLAAIRRRGPGAAVARRRGRIRARRGHALAARRGSPARTLLAAAGTTLVLALGLPVLRVCERPCRPAARPAALAQRVPRRAARPRHTGGASSSAPPRGSRRGGSSAFRCCSRWRRGPRCGRGRPPSPWRLPSTSRSSSAATSAWRSTAGRWRTARRSRSSSTASSRGASASPRASWPWPWAP